MLTRGQFELMLVSASLFVVTLSVNLQVPLYREYSEGSGFGEWFVASVFSAYILGLVPVLIFLGGVSDYIGTRNAILLALLLSGLANLLVIVNHSLPVLFVMRFLQGASVGFVLGASAVFISQKNLRTADAANLHGVLVALGLGGGALITSIAIYLFPENTPFSFYIVTLIVTVCFFGVCLIDNDCVAVSEGLFRLPIITRESWIYCYAIFAAWSLVGVVISVVPSELNRLGLTGWTGLIVFLAISTGALFQPMCREKSSVWSVRVGVYTGVLAAMLLLMAIWYESGALLIIAAALTGGCGLGFIYIGGLSSVMRFPLQKRSRAVSGYFTIGYLGLGLPCILVGFFTDIFGLVSAVTFYVISLSLISFLVYIIYLSSIKRFKNSMVNC